MSNSYQGFNNQVLTFKKGKNLSERVLVTLNTEEEAVNASTTFVGVVDSIRGNIAGIQMEGYVEFPYSGTQPLRGLQALESAEEGRKVSVNATGKHFYRVLTVDVNKRIIGFIL